MSRYLITALLLASSLSAPVLAETTAEDADSQQLPPIDVTGRHSPIDSQRPRYEKMAPCVGCEGDRPEERESFLMKVLNFTVLPSTPPDNRDLTPISLRQQPQARFKDKQQP